MFLLAIRNLLDRPLSTSLNLVLVGLGIGIISLVVNLSNQVEDQFSKNISGIDMVVGAKGSPLQLILSSVFQIDNPTGNIPLTEVERLEKNRLIEKTYRMSFGDSYQGRRIVGVSKNYLDLYNVEIVGSLWSSPMEVVLGSQVMNSLSMEIGDELISSHGLADMGQEHDDSHFEIVGVMKPTGTVVDHLILTSYESVWQVHDYDTEDPKEITALLVKFSSPMGLIRLPRYINSKTSMMAALPSYELTRLYSLMGVGVQTLNLVALAVVVVSLFSVFVSLFSSLNSRSSEMALLRVYGASKLQLMQLILTEGAALTFLGGMLGLMLSKVGLIILSQFGVNQFNQDLDPLLIGSVDILLIFGALFIGLLAASLPAIRVYRVDISKTIQ